MCPMLQLTFINRKTRSNINRAVDYNSEDWSEFYGLKEDKLFGLGECNSDKVCNLLFAFTIEIILVEIIFFKNVETASEWVVYYILCDCMKVYIGQTQEVFFRRWFGGGGKEGHRQAIKVFLQINVIKFR